MQPTPPPQYREAAPASREGVIPDNVWDEILAENESGPIPVPPIGAANLNANPFSDPFADPRMSMAPVAAPPPPLKNTIPPPAPVQRSSPAWPPQSPISLRSTIPPIPPPPRGSQPSIAPSSSQSLPQNLPRAAAAMAPTPDLVRDSRDIPREPPPVPPADTDETLSALEREVERRARVEAERRATLEERLFGGEDRSWEPPLDVDAAAWALGQQADEPDASDPLDFASNAVVTEDIDISQRLARPPPVVLTPWDDGPSRTSVVTLGAEDDHDAVAEQTPLPEIEREQFFGRGANDEPQGSALSEMLGSGSRPAMKRVLPGQPLVSPNLGPEIMIDEPVEMPERPSASTQRESPEALLRDAKDRYHLHDFAGAVELLRRINPGEPGAEEARALLAESRMNLTRMYESKIGDFDQIPHLLISNEEVIWLNLNHRAGFILSQVDGAVTYDDLIALSGMPRLDTLEIITELLQNKVIGTD